jgi:SRSO17 transposase
MDRQRSDASAERFSAYLDSLASVIGHAARVGPMRDYCTGLLLPCERKSVEPMAAATAPAQTSAQHQSLLHFISQGAWSDAAVLGKVREHVLPCIESHGAIEAWIVDDTGFPKYGEHSVGVAHQYCGQVGKQTNCQIAVSLSLANHHASLPVAYRLYLTESWAKDSDRRKVVGIPEDVEFTTKPKMALRQIEWAVQSGLPHGVVLMDGAYGSDLSFRKRMTELELTYSVAVRDRALVAMTTPGAKPIRAADLAKSLRQRDWRTITWRNGTNTPLKSRFQRVRVRAAGDGTTDDEPVEWLLIEWPRGEKEPTKFWLSTLSEATPIDRMVDITMMRWRIVPEARPRHDERDYHDLKQEVGLGDFEGRGWRGFHHHATMCIAAYGFLVSERGAFPPSGPRSWSFIEEFTVPEGYRPRGSPAPA